jgi:pimeloyl-ACP methyl ester carboxylesterase
MPVSEGKLLPGIHVVHDDSRQTRPVLLIHGSVASGSTWAPVVPALAQHFHAIRADFVASQQ